MQRARLPAPDDTVLRFCKALLTEMDFSIAFIYGKNFSDDSMLVARSNNPFFVFSKLGSLKLSLDAWNLIVSGSVIFVRFIVLV